MTEPPTDGQVSNTMDSREGWLRAATNELRPVFASVGVHLPDNIRFAIAFPSTGRRSRRIGECWDATASADQHFEIFIRADYADPIEVMAVLVHELVHAGVGLEAKHGKTFKRAARAIGLDGPMRSTIAGPRLLEDLARLSEAIGPLPHAKLSWGLSDRPKKQDTRQLKIECVSCSFILRGSAKQLTDIGLPLCPVHGPMVCDGLIKGEGNTIHGS